MTTTPPSKRTTGSSSQPDSKNGGCAAQRHHQSTSTVGRGKAVTLESVPESNVYRDEHLEVRFGDSLKYYDSWPAPTIIVSDGAYGLLGFERDTHDHLGIPDWYEPHIRAWSEHALPGTALWFWNSEIGWAAAHPVLERYGWRYVSCNIWNKGKGHIAGNVRTSTIRQFPVVTELCVHYVRAHEIDNVPLKKWLRDEWVRSGLPLRRANEACGVRDAATRKYFDQGHLWYFPPPDAFEKLASYANRHGRPQGKPYFSIDGKRPITRDEWAAQRSKFVCPHGYTNVWNRPSVRGEERVTVNGTKSVHLNQKPMDLMKLIIEASSEEGDVVWEPFGGLFSACLAAHQLKRNAFGAEIDPTYFQFGVERIKASSTQLGPR